MKRVFMLVLPAVLLAGVYCCVYAQTFSEKPIVPVGTTARLALRTPISSKLSDVGDRVSATLDEDLIAEDGRVIAPAGTEFIGRITQIRAAGRLQREASLTLIFEKMRLSDRSENIFAVVTAIDDYATDRRLKAKNGTGKIEGGRSAGRTGSNAAKGAAVGSLLGIVGTLSGGGYRSFPIGLDSGLILGVVLTKGTEIRLGAETILRIRFEKTPVSPASTKKTIDGTEENAPYSLISSPFEWLASIKLPQSPEKKLLGKLSNGEYIFPGGKLKVKIPPLVEPGAKIRDEGMDDVTQVILTDDFGAFYRVVVLDNSRSEYGVEAVLNVFKGIREKEWKTTSRGKELRVVDLEKEGAEMVLTTWKTDEHGERKVEQQVPDLLTANAAFAADRMLIHIVAGLPVMNADKIGARASQVKELLEKFLLGIVTVSGKK